MPTISVLMPAHNASKFISESIISIIEQTYTDFEFLIIDDGSTDNTWDILTNFAKCDKRIKIYRNPKRLGIVKTRNKLFSLVNSDSEYFAIFDADDISLPARLKIQLSYLRQNPKIGAIGSNIFIIDETGRAICMRKYPQSYHEIKKTILHRSPCCQPAVMIRKSVFAKVGGYRNGNFDRGNDYDLWLRIAAQSEIQNLPEILLKYRIQSLSVRSKYVKETLKSTLLIQSRWLFKKEYFRLSNFLHFGILCGLLIVPSGLILRLFYKLRFSKCKN